MPPSRYETQITSRSLAYQVTSQWQQRPAQVTPKFPRTAVRAGGNPLTTTYRHAIGSMAVSIGGT
jgi:hypothetical protein